MSKGILLFAFDTLNVSYFTMAAALAKRVNYFLDLPVTVITDKTSSLVNHSGIFEHVIIIDPIKTNLKDKQVWMNRGRSQSYDLSPYDETIVLDVDYLVNSDKLKTLFDLGTDFCCHDNAHFLLWPDSKPEVLSPKSYSTLWATVMYFARSKRTKQIFDCMKMVENNYHYYSILHGFFSMPYRNDYALTLAVRIANGHLDEKSLFIPWKLLHTDKNTRVHKQSQEQNCTKFKVSLGRTHKGKLKNEYILVEDCDFHVMNKACVQELCL